jgi:hypothetical protein
MLPKNYQRLKQMEHDDWHLSCGGIENSVVRRTPQAATKTLRMKKNYQRLKQMEMETFLVR